MRRHHRVDVSQNRAMNLLNRIARRDGQFIVEPPAPPIEHPQCVAGATATVLSNHGELHQPLAGLILGRQAQDLVRDGRMIAQAEFQLEEILQRRQPRRIQRLPQWWRRPMVRVPENRAAPQGQRRAQQIATGRRPAGRAPIPGPLQEDVRVYDLLWRDQGVRRPARFDGDGGLASIRGVIQQRRHRGPQLRHARLEHGARTPRRFVSPQQIDESVGGDRPADLQRQHAEDETLLLPGERQGASVVPDLNRSQHEYRRHRRLLPSDRSAQNVPLSRRAANCGITSPPQAGSL
jgi:hypothetical protein